MTIDAVLTKTNNVYDFNIDSNGDIETDDFFDTAILVSLLGEQRATASEMPVAERRRGWIGNESTPGVEMGSKLWLYEQAKVTRTTLAGIQKVAFNALKWLIDEGYAIDISTEATLSNGEIVLTVTIERPNTKVEKRFYELWQNTGIR